MALTRILFGFAALWLLLLFAGSLYSPPFINSDPGLGFLDLINFSEGGSFQHHRIPTYDLSGNCKEEKTTWWSPGQWFFIYLFTLAELPLGIAVSCTVLLAVAFGLWGWLRFYRKFGFSENTIFYAGLLILFSRYLVSAFQIYPGANILEFAIAPWFLLIWLDLEKKPIWLQSLVLLPILVVSYFIKSSMLIFWLGVIGSGISLFKLRQARWVRVAVLLLVFLVAKYLCDFLFTGGGPTPFSYPGKWIIFSGGNRGVVMQNFLFVLNGPLLATIGLDDYIRYVFQKPGSVIFDNGHPFLLLLYLAFLFCFFLLIRYFLKTRLLIKERYTNLVVAVTAVFIAFFLYTLISGKNINGYEESRHFRLAGLLVLPIALQYLSLLLKRFLFLLPLFLFGYATLSYANKLNQSKVLSAKYRVPLSEFRTKQDYETFKTAALKADFVYVVYAELKFDLNHCKTIAYQDDFLPLEVIRSKPKTVIQNKCIVFLLPERFAYNGKREAILANYTEANAQNPPTREIKKLNNWELITVNYH